VTFEGAPAPQKGAQPHYIAPWHMRLSLEPLSKLSSTLLLDVAASLLDQFSYWDVDQFLDWLNHELTEARSA
jgi:hypothetical protein